MIDLDMETESRLDEKNHGISEYEQLSFKDFLKHKSRETGDIPVLFEKDEIYTWMDLEMASQIIAEDLSKQGVRRGTHVGICGSNSINWISTFFAVHKLGAMALLINPQQRTKEIANIARIGEITHFCYGEMPEVENEDAILRMAESEENPIQEIYSIKNTKKIRGRFGEYEGLSAKFPESIEPDYPCVMIFTSGSTGNPKGVILSSYNVLRASEISHRNLRITSEDKI